jgi:deferrochelatase/peroxidase EfeB
MQVDALHADAERLAAAADQGGILPCIQDQVTVLAADILRAMERLHATSTLLASAAAARRTREAGGSVRKN